MDSSFLYLVVGFLAGTLASGLLLLWISNQNKKKQDASLENRNQIIRSIAEIFTDIDSLITSFRTDLLSEDKFRSSLYSKLDAANKIYKPNMHLLDLYFVKFTDMQFARYHQLAHGKLTNLQLDGQMAFDNEIAAVEKSSDLISSPDLNKNISKSSTGFFTDKAVTDSSEVFNKTKKEDINTNDDVCVMDDEKEDEQIPDFEFVSMGPDQDQVVVEEQPATVDEQPAIADEQPVIIEDEKPVVVDAKPVTANDEQLALVDEQPVIANNDKSASTSDESVIIDEAQSTIIDEQPIAVDEKQTVVSDKDHGMAVEEISAIEDSRDAKDFNDEIVFEVNPEKTLDKKETASISNTTTELSNNADPDKSNISFADESVKEQKSSFQQEFEQVTKEPQEEEMLETIMDLDMGKFLRTGSLNIESIDKNALPPKYAASGRGTDENKENVLQVKEKDSSAGRQQKTTQSDKKTEGQEKIVIARGDDGSQDTILEEEPTDTELSNKAGEVNDVAITGDDVAS